MNPGWQAATRFAGKPAPAMSGSEGAREHIACFCTLFSKHHPENSQCPPDVNLSNRPRYWPVSLP